ncbi:hypothetical protein HWV62_30517 [Athelia sp. TMB]|nr:hypothetical protein HWV62_30517 [Athelia sp. TMB]
MPVPPPDEGQAPADNLNGDLPTADDIIPPGDSVSHSAETFAHLEVASTEETVTHTVPAQPETHQCPDTATQSPAPPYRDDLVKANALKAQSAAFSDHGQREEALTAITEATNLLRTLAFNHPTTCNSELASSLRILSSSLAVVSRKEEALSAIEEAVKLQRVLASEHPSEFTVELASSLIHHSNRLSKLNRHEEALLAIQESVDRYRITIKDQPETARSGLAASLYNLSSRLSRYELQEEALAAIEEACSIYRVLAVEQPALHGKNLAASLKKLSACTNGSAQQVGAAGSHTLGAASGRPRPIGSRRGQVAASGSTFYAFGNNEVIQIAGDYVTADEEPVAKISRLLTYASGASWDPSLTCLPGTRLTLLEILGKWARGAASERICWLKGPAGCGKTTVLHTIAQELKEEGLLASAFFFSRDTESRNTAKNLLTTLARDIASLHPDAAQDIADALEDEPALASAPLSRQFDALILGPCRHLPADRLAVFVIDALDESIADDLDTQLLTILRDKATQLPPQVRILLTSRPTRVIEKYLSGRSHIVAHSIDVHSVENKGDIDMYVDRQLRDEAVLHNMGLTSPDETIIRDLKHLAEGLFIWIVTVCNFLHTAHRPKDKLQALLSKSFQHGSPPEKKMDLLYTAILAECGDWDDDDFVKDYDLVMGTIMALKRPLSLDALRDLHDGSLDLNAEQLLQRFGSVLTGFRDGHQPIRVLHSSFHEFVTDRAANDDSTKRFHLSEKEHSGRLAELCIKTLNRELARRIDGTGYLAIDTPDVGIPKILDISEQLVYGCAHWPSHLQDVEIPLTIQPHIVTLISRHLVRWIEVLAATDVFHGSFQVVQWVQQRAPELEHHFQHESQAYALSALGNRLSFAARMEESLLATQEGVILFRALAMEQPTLYNGDFAGHLQNLSSRLADLGRAEDALSTAEESANLHMALAAEQPTVYNARLAISLVNFSNRLSDLSRAQEALSAVEKAVHLRRALAGERPAAYNADLAASLNTLSNCLSELGRAREALLAVEEAVNLRRARAAERPAAYDADLASYLSSLSNHLSALGRSQDALSVEEEGVNLYRALAMEQPAVYNGGLACGLMNLSVRLARLGRAQEASSAGEEAVDLYRPLAAEQPAKYNANLASSLSNSSLHLSALGRVQEALSAAEEAVDLYRVLAAERPAAYNGDFAKCLHNVSKHLSALGRAQEALLAVEEAVNLYRALAAERPASERPVSYTADLATFLTNSSSYLSALGRAQEALSAGEEAVNLRRALAAERPAAYNADLASSLNKLSNDLSAFGRAREALSAAEEAVNLNRALAAERPAAYNADLASSLGNLSNHLSALGRAQEALLAGEEGVNLYRVLAAERPAAHNGDLATSLSNLSAFLSDLGRAQEALSAVEEAVMLRRALVAEQPAAYNADLASSLGNLSNHLSALGRAQEALFAGEEGVNLYRALAAERPAAYNGDLATSLSNLSAFLSALGRAQEALSAVEEAVMLRRALAAERPAACNAHLAMSLGNLSNRLSELGRTQEALSAAQETAILFRSLATERPAAYNTYLAQSLQALSHCLIDLGRDDEALVAIPEAVELYRALAVERPAQFNKPLMASLIVLNNAMVGLGMGVPTEIREEIRYLQARVA